MRRFGDLPFRQKLVLMMMMTGTVAVLVMFAAMTGYEWLRFRHWFVRGLMTEAEMVGANCSAALAFSDVRAATEILGALRARPEITHAWLLRSDGRPFATFGGAGPPVPTLDSGHQFGPNEVILCQPVKFGDDIIGRICLRASLREQHLRLWTYVAIAVGVVIVALATAFWLSARLQRLVSDPVLSLTRAVRAVGEHRDYALRVTKTDSDEIGVLIDGFNTMLAQIEQRDAELQASEARFRQVMETIQEVFWLRDGRDNKFIYVSPAYERIWGRRRDELYLSPGIWLDAVHPDDRGRVRQSMLREHTHGQFDEEYRILRPDGAIRWVRDRAFAVRDAEGQAIRIAGISEDVTERKRLEREILDISDREQRRIGQDIHDGLCQQLVGVAFVARLLENKLAKTNSPCVNDAHEIGVLLQQSVTEARNLSHGLSPVRLDKDGLQLALHELTGSVSAVFNIPCAFDCPVPARVDDSTAATHLYRIAQEAINNAVKHARAQHLTIRLLQGPATLTLAVEDDGIGIPANIATKGIGLHVMHSRARLIGATLSIQRGPAGGTILTCAYPQPE